MKCFWTVLVAWPVAIMFSGCAVGYTFFNSESKLDRLSVAMPKDVVIKKVGKPDLVLRDDGRILIWQYNFNTSRQWLYELSLCPVSIWIGGCIFYPFTNWVSERHREHAVHLILVNDQLCTWGLPIALMHKKKGCTGLATFEDEPLSVALRQRDVLTAAYGPISPETISAYPIVAVWSLTDAPEAPGSGARVSNIITNLLLDLEVTVVERARLEQVLAEQTVQLIHSDEASLLKVGKIAGAKAIVIGDVQQWSSDPSDKAAQVSLSLRMVDVETGQVLFQGEGRSTEGLSENADNIARLIVHRIMSRLAVKVGLLGTGRIGVRWEWRQGDGARGYVVHDVTAGSPADLAGIKPGDVVVACHEIPLSTVATAQDGKRACRVDAGQLLPLRILRGNEHLEVMVPAERRPGL